MAKKRTGGERQSVCVRMFLRDITLKQAAPIAEVTRRGPIPDTPGLIPPPGQAIQYETQTVFRATEFLGLSGSGHLDFLDTVRLWIILRRISTFTNRDGSSQEIPSGSDYYGWFRFPIDFLLNC